MSRYLTWPLLSIMPASAPFLQFYTCVASSWSTHIVEKFKVFSATQTGVLLYGGLGNRTHKLKISTSPEKNTALWQHCRFYVQHCRFYFQHCRFVFLALPILFPALPNLFSALPILFSALLILFPAIMGRAISIRIGTYRASLHFLAYRIGSPRHFLKSDRIVS